MCGAEPPSMLLTLNKILEKLDQLYNMLNETLTVERQILKILSEKPPLSREEKLPPEGMDVLTLLELPDHLRRTIMALGTMDKATAEDVAKITGRKRALESAYLNQLTNMGYVKRARQGRKVYFMV